MSAGELYRCYDADWTLLYIGTSLNAINRLLQHKRTAKWFLNLTHLKVERFHSRQAACIAEILAIRREKPLFNAQHSLNTARNTINNGVRQKPKLTGAVVSHGQIIKVSLPVALTDDFINQLKPAKRGKRYTVRDAIVPGLVVRVTCTGHKAFMLVTRPLNEQGRVVTDPRMFRIATVREITVEQARVVARRWKEERAAQMTKSVIKRLGLGAE